MECECDCYSKDLPILLCCMECREGRCSEAVCACSCRCGTKPCAEVVRPATYETPEDHCERDAEPGKAFCYTHRREPTARTS